MHLELQSLREGYAELGAEVLRRGSRVSPRGEETAEMLGASFTLLDPVDSLPVGTGRGVVKALGAVETLQLIGGFHDPSALVAAAPHFVAYLGPDGAQRAPYGPRLADQIPAAAEALAEDRDSRRAQVTVWDPCLDSERGLHDYPCTTSLQWFIRDDELHMQVHMRSNDFWLGVPYDVFQFTQLQLAVASVLGVGVGVYRHSAASLHVYERHCERTDALTAPTGDALPTYGIRADTWKDAVTRARAIHAHVLPIEPSAGERWLHLAMAGASVS